MLASLRRLRLKVFLETGIDNIRYLTGFTGSSAYLIFSEKKSMLLTDSRYASQAREEVKKNGFSVKIYKKDIFSVIAGEVKKLSLRGPVGIDGGALSYNAATKLKAALKPLRLRPMANVTGPIRKVKEPAEVALIKRSASILEGGFKKVQRLLRPGAVERAVARKVEDFFISRGASGPSFGSIVASGPRGALPHGKASDKEIKKGELVVVDMGVRYRGYCSDATRTFAVGSGTRLQKKIYRIVKEAQMLAIERIGEGVKASRVDSAARAHIKKSGYGKYFGHGTGHGLGLAVHEGPGLAPGSKDVLTEGMVVTVEPGIYLPGWGGVRIEDMVLVTKDGSELLTNSPEKLLSL
ncbi:MAG: M24 family metallopeptidase [Thermodesulfobacteriota bacterium]